MKKPDGFKVVSDKVLVVADMEPDEDGGIIIPDSCRIHDWTAEVAQVGQDVKSVQPGDRVLYSKDTAVIPFSDEQNYRILRESGIIATLEADRQGGDYEKIMPRGVWVLCRADKGLRVLDGIELPETKRNKVFGAEIIRSGDKASEFRPGNRVYFDTSLAISCVENDEVLCSTSKHDIDLYEIC